MIDSNEKDTHDTFVSFEKAWEIISEIALKTLTNSTNC